jgi:energy-coupling factor transport system ATP-binding protein
MNAALSEIDLRPVMLIQFPERQLFCKTVEDEVAYGLIARGVDKPGAISRSHVALRQVGLAPEEFAHRDPFSLSGGQKRRVIIAAAVALDAPLYILDEPQAALDDDGLATLARLCVSWLARGASYLLISHDLEFLRSMTGRILVIDGGRVLFDGSWAGLDASPNMLVDIGFAEI